MGTEASFPPQSGGERLPLPGCCHQRRANAGGKGRAPCRGPWWLTKPPSPYLSPTTWPSLPPCLCMFPAPYQERHPVQPSRMSLFWGALFDYSGSRDASPTGPQEPPPPLTCTWIRGRLGVYPEAASAHTHRLGVPRECKPTCLQSSPILPAPTFSTGLCTQSSEMNHDSRVSHTPPQLRHDTEHTDSV